MFLHMLMLPGHHYMKCLRLKLLDDTHHIKPEMVQALIYEAVNVSDKIQPSVLLRPFDAILEARISLLETFLPVTLTYLTTMSSRISQRSNFNWFAIRSAQFTYLSQIFSIDSNSKHEIRSHPSQFNLL